MVRSRIGIIVPAFNESATIKSVVEAVKAYGEPIVVDDGSADNTAELAARAGAVVVSHDKNRGYDSALNTGFIKASELGVEIIITVDADGQHDPSLIQEFIYAIEAGADVVVGIRSRRQRIAEHIFAWYTRLRYGINDPMCGMKAYRKSVYDALGYFDSYGSIGTELMLFAATKGYQFRQISFVLRERDGNSKFGQMLLGNYKILCAMMLWIWRVK